jgi:hypothetical protein
VAVIDTESIKSVRKGFDVGGHVLPEPRVVRRFLAVSQLDAVAPYDDFAAKVCFAGQEGEILEGISSPDPAIVGERVDEGVSRGTRSNAGEEWFNKRVSRGKLAWPAQAEG